MTETEGFCFTKRMVTSPASSFCWSKCSTKHGNDNRLRQRQNIRLRFQCVHKANFAQVAGTSLSLSPTAKAQMYQDVDLRSSPFIVDIGNSCCCSWPVPMHCRCDGNQEFIEFAHKHKWINQLSELVLRYILWMSVLRRTILVWHTTCQWKLSEFSKNSNPSSKACVAFCGSSKIHESSGWWGAAVRCFVGWWSNDKRFAGNQHSATLKWIFRWSD